MDTEKLIITDQAVKNAKAMGIVDNTRKQLLAMIRSAAPCTHMEGNWRYEDFVFNVRDNEMKSVHWFTYETKMKREGMCLDCNNDGGFCLTCGSTNKNNKSMV